MTSNKRRQKRERERQILAQMDAAMQEQAQTAEPQAPTTETPTQPVVHCKRCKTVMEKGVCLTCGFRIYQPIDETLRRKIRWTITGVCLIAFVIVYFAFIK